MERKPILEMKKVSKQFPGVKALDQVDFCLYPGEIHILAGENGAGKSTLSKCMLGICQHEEGVILYKGEKASFHSAGEAAGKGIVAVHQELSMIPYLNVSQNIFFGREPTIGHSGLIDQRKMTEDTKLILQELNCSDIDLQVPVKKLGIAEQQMIEIAKALSFQPQILILDEPTSSLTSHEIQSLFQKLRQLKARGVAILYISHRMEEYEQIGDRITVMRDGKRIKTVKTGDLSEKDLIRLIVGRDIHEFYQRTMVPDKKDYLRVIKISDKKHKVNACSMNVKRGEIVGIAGLMGAGRTELARLIFGIDKPSSGEVYFDDKKVTGRSPEYMVKNGVGFLTEDRKRTGLAINASIAWNIVAAGLQSLFPTKIISEKKNTLIAGKYADQLNIATPDVKRSVGELSGGNQQKVVIAKWLAANTKLLIFDEPTRGIDVGAKTEIYKWMDQFVSEGGAILMISSDLQELMGMCDRMYVMRQGTIAGSMTKVSYSAAAIGQMMMGEKEI